MKREKSRGSKITTSIILHGTKTTMDRVWSWATTKFVQLKRMHLPLSKDKNETDIHLQRSQFRLEPRMQNSPSPKRRFLILFAKKAILESLAVSWNNRFCDVARTCQMYVGCQMHKTLVFTQTFVRTSEPFTETQPCKWTQSWIHGN